MSILRRAWRAISGNPADAPHLERGMARSPQWPALRKQHLLLHPKCEFCGGTEDLEVHHRAPFHLHPELELAAENLITLCSGARNCHLLLGHLLDYHASNPVVAEDCARMQDKITHRSQT